MKVLLTGAAGRLDSATLCHFHEAPVDMRATDIRVSVAAPVKIQVANLLEPETCYALMENVEVVMHLANHLGLGGRTAQKVYSDNTTMNMSPNQIIERLFRDVPLRRPIEQIDALWDISAITAQAGWKSIDNFRDMK